MPDDDLTQAAQHARKVLPGPIGDCVAARLEMYDEREQDGDLPEWRAERARALAAAVLAMSAPSPVVDRDGLARLIDDEINAIHNANGAPEADDEDLRSEGEIAADALISAGLVRTPVTAGQIRQAAQALHDDPTSNTKGWLHLAHCAVKALGLSVVEGGEQRG